MAYLTRMIIIFLIFPVIGFSATFKLDTNETIKGKLLELNPVSARIHSDYGEISIPVKKIIQMDFTGENYDYILTLNDKSVIKGNLISLDSGTYVVNTSLGIINVVGTSVIYLIEKGYKRRIIEKRKSEDLKTTLGRVNQIVLLVYSGMLQDSLANKYENGIQFMLGFDRPFFKGSLQKLKLGLMLGYEHLPAKESTEISLDILTVMFSTRYLFPLASKGFFSNLFPFLRLGIGGSLIKLTKSSGSSEAGLNPSLLAGAGLDFTISNSIGATIEFDYFTILESPDSLQELRLGAGIVMKF